MYPNSTSVSVNAGSSRYFTCVRTFAPSSHCAVTGSHPSQIEKTRMRMIPVTNSGIAANESPAIVIPLSVGRP